MSYTDVFGGDSIFPSHQRHLLLNYSADVTLVWPIEQQGGGSLVASVLDLNPSASGLSVLMPDARQASTGVATVVNNISADTTTLKDNTGGTIATVLPGTVWVIYMTDNSTQAGTWRTFQMGASVSQAQAASLAGAGTKAIGSTLNLIMSPTSTSSSPVTLVDSDRAKLTIWTGGVGTLNFPAPGTVGSDWFTIIRNSGSGDLTLTPPSGTIDGAATLALAAGQSCIVVTNGTNFFTVGLGTASTSTFNFTSINVAGSGDYTLSGVELNKVAYRFTGTLTGNRNIIVPGAVEQYWVDNSTSGAFSLFVKTAAQVGPPEVAQGDRAILYCDGVDVIPAQSSGITFPISVAQGGTGSSTAAAARTALSVPPTSRLVSAGTGLTGGGDLSSDRTLSLSHLGLESLVDPNADRIAFWDDGGGAMNWLSLAETFLINGTVLGLKNFKVKTAQTDRSIFPTLTDDNHLFGYSLENGKYLILGALHALNVSTPGGGMKFNLQATGGSVTWEGIALSNNNNTDTLTSQSFDQSTYDANFPDWGSVLGVNIFISGILNVAGGPSTIDFQWAQNSSHANLTRLLGGSLLGFVWIGS